jgi:undecaprenyl-diphosphatase
MWDFLYQIDLKIFYFLNHTISNPLFDKFFPFITDGKNWNIAYVILFLIMIIKGGRIGRLAAAGTILLIITTDQFSSNFLKNLFERVRPCNALPDVNILVTCTQSFSFPSSHAVNNFGGAFYFSKIFPKYKIALFTVAALVSLSRPYVGVHYPSDIIGGALIGSAIGYIFALLVLKADAFISGRKNKITDKYERVGIK